tara:strand:- start:413 stop:1261 length:849 start_codon:yes stop_codon:yes gene_type:complete
MITLLGAAVGSAVISGIGSAIGASRAKKEARAARYARDRAQARINSIIASRQDIVNPYGGVTDLSGMAKDLSSNLTNPYAQLGVATQAAEIQMEQSDIALANTLDTLRATGSGAGGATALAQAALQSKKGISANIEQQEAQNEKLRAQGEANLNQQRMSEAQRLQGIAISEGQRLQSAEAAGKQFEFTAQENRTNADLDAAAGGVAQANQNIAQANQNRASANAGFISAVGSIGSAALGGYAGKAGPTTKGKVIGEIEMPDFTKMGDNAFQEEEEYDGIRIG